MVNVQQSEHISKAHKAVTDALAELEKAKSNERTPDDRRLAIVITELDKAEAILTAWFKGL